MRGKTFRLFAVLKYRFGVSDFLFSQCFSQRPEDSVLGTFFYGCRQTIVKFSTELYQVILCRSKNRNICVGPLALAQRGAGHVNPNPMVGCVIVKDGKIIGEGWHEHIGGLHAERNAFAHCTEDCTGADLYVTLEPCCHWGRTPPCTDAVIEHKIGRVFVGCLDPNPLVAGKGAQILRDAGIEVETACARTNAAA